MALTNKTKIKANLVFFLVGAVGLVYAMATQVLSVLENRYSAYAIFPDAGGVFTNQEVTYRGITVGQVGDMEVVEDGVRIELRIRKEFEIPADDIEARVMFKSAVGEQFVDLLPGSDEPPYLQNGSEIPLSQTSIPVSTQELLAAVEGVLRGVPPEALEGAVDALGLGLTGRGSDIETILRSTAELAELFAERAPEVEGILVKGTDVGRAFLATKEDFAAAIRDLVTVADTLSGATGDLERLLKGTNVASDEIIALIEKHRPALNRVIKELAEVNALQADHADDLRRLLFNLPTTLDLVTSTFEPDTGMIRFGLVQETERPACSYGTERRAPQDRGPRPIPKNASCDEAGAPDGTPLPRVAGPDASSAAGVSLLDGFGGAGTLRSGPLLPARMADWSWTLFYLNVM